MKQRLPLLVLLAFLTAALHAGVSSHDAACAGNMRHAGERIRFSLTDERTFCVEFSEQEISGVKALRATGLPVVTKVDPQFGEFVCKIGDVGTDLSDCPARDGSYWSYFVLDGNGIWRPSSVGASGSKVRCGSGEGWSWFARGAGALPSGPTSFAQMCSGRTCSAQNSPDPNPSQTSNEVNAGPGRPHTNPRSRSATPSQAPLATPSIELFGTPAAEPSGSPRAEASGVEERRQIGGYVPLAAALLVLTSVALFIRYRAR